MFSAMLRRFVRVSRMETIVYQPSIQEAEDDGRDGIIRLWSPFSLAAVVKSHARHIKKSGGTKKFQAASSSLSATLTLEAQSHRGLALHTLHQSTDCPMLLPRYSCIGGCDWPAHLNEGAPSFKGGNIGRSAPQASSFVG